MKISNNDNISSEAIIKKEKACYMPHKRSIKRKIKK